MSEGMADNSKTYSSITAVLVIKTQYCDSYLSS
jgi:hypothetical protein